MSSIGKVNVILNKYLLLWRKHEFVFLLLKKHLTYRYFCQLFTKALTELFSHTVAFEMLMGENCSQSRSCYLFTCIKVRLFMSKEIRNKESVQVCLVMVFENATNPEVRLRLN